MVGGDASEHPFLGRIYNRFQNSFPKENIFLVTPAPGGGNIKKRLPGLPEENLLLEPYKRGSATCMYYTSLKILRKNPEAVILASPADYEIMDEDLFASTIDLSMDFVAKNDVLMTLGIIPRSAKTNFGYIQVKEGRGAHFMDQPLTVKTFTEKPPVELAEVFLRTGEFFWNSGIFIWKASTIKAEITRYIPEIADMFEGWENAVGTPSEAAFVEKAYSEAPKVSLDYGVMERTDKAWLYPSRFGWADQADFC